jgi:hypothetical protein
MNEIGKIKAIRKTMENVNLHHTKANKSTRYIHCALCKKCKWHINKKMEVTNQCLYGGPFYD